jgi:Right handed beta helix region
MTIRHLLLSLLLATTAHAQAADWYVSATAGDDANTGKSKAAAFKSLKKAHEAVQAGDTVWVGDGLYTDADRSDGSAVLDITRSGREGAWITWKALPGHKPEVRGMGWGGITIKGSYHVIDGFHVIGNNDSIVLLKAQEDAKNPKADPYFNTNGILVNGRTNARDAKPHHVVIRNCVVGKNAGGGITVLEADYVTIEDNLVFENAWFMRYGGSGITTLGLWQFDDKPGYHIVIQRNVVWNNKTQVNWEKVGRLSDGNGILLDVTDNDDLYGATNPNADAAVQAAAAASIASSLPANRQSRPKWTARSLIANNLTAFNGGSGIHTFRTAHVDIINNTTYWNGGIVGYPELFANRSQDVVILNNIIQPRPGSAVTSNNRNVDVRWDYNLYPKAQDVLKGPNDIVADPQFIDTPREPVRGSFRLAKGSAGLDSGSNDVPQAGDLTGAKRPAGKARDRGAYEQ